MRIVRNFCEIIVKYSESEKIILNTLKYVKTFEKVI